MLNSQTALACSRLSTSSLGFNKPFVGKDALPHLGVGFFFILMTTLATEVNTAFKEMLKFAPTTINYDGDEFDVVEAEAEVVADLVVGSIDHDLEGAIVASKGNFTSGQPPIGAKFIMGVHLCRIESISTQGHDPTYTIGYSLIMSDPLESTLGDPSLVVPDFPCLVLDGGDADHDCE